MANAYPWINPVGGMGDALMLSGVLKMVHDTDPTRKFNLIRRTAYLDILGPHPAIADIGYLPEEAPRQDMAYWAMEPLGPNAQRPFQILARAFGLKTPVEEKLYLPEELDDDPVLYDFLPWGTHTVVIAPSSASPRKELPLTLWQPVIDRLVAEGILVLQVGRAHETHLRGAYSLLGLTTPHEVVALLRRVDAVLTCDSFIMHAAHLTGTPAVVTWGPTDHEVYGYPEQIHMLPRRECPERADCIGPTRGQSVYATPCSREQHCMDSIEPEEITRAVMGLLDGRPARRKSSAP